jgi:hypothetical protein
LWRAKRETSPYRRVVLAVRSGIWSGLVLLFLLLTLPFATRRR